MKHKSCLFIIFVLLLSFMAGCATDGTSPISNEDTQDVIITITARDLAFFVGRNNPEFLDNAIAFCSAFSNADPIDVQPLIVQGLKYLDLEVADYPMAKKDLETLLTLFNIEILNADIPLTPRQLEMVKIAAIAMKEGFELAKQNPKEVK